MNQTWGPMCGPMCCYSETLCVCFLRRYFPLTKHKTAVNCLNTSHHHWTLSIYSWLFPQLSHSSSLVNIHFPQMEMVLRKTAQALDLLSGQAKLGTYGWSQCICSGLLTQPWDPESWSKGVLASPFMPRGTRPPEVQIVSIIVRWAQWSWNPGQT